MEKISNHIEEYFTKTEGSKDLIVSKEIFNAENENIDLKTDLTIEEIKLLNTLIYNNKLLISRGLKPVYEPFINAYMRLKISLKRQSRGEYVDINRNNDISKGLQDLSNAKELVKDKK